MNILPPVTCAGRLTGQECRLADRLWRS